MTDYLVEITGIDDRTLAPVTLRYATLPTFMTGPWDSPPNAVYEPRLLSPGNYELHLWGSGATRGASAVTAGVIRVDNSDRALDRIKTWGFDGQPVVVRRCPAGGLGRYPADFPVIASLTVSALDFDWKTAKFSIRDINQMVSVLPFQPNTFGGTNVLPAGVDGIVTDLQYKCKPVLLGRVNNMAPPCVNTAQQIYQISDRTSYPGLPYTVTAVYDKGAALGVGVNRGSLAALLAATPATSYFDWCDDPAGCFVKLGSMPAGTVTADAYEGTAIAQRTLAQVMTRVLTGPGGIAATAINGAAALDAVAPGEVGLWVYTGTLDPASGQVATTTIGALLDALANTANAYWVNNRDGTWWLGALVAPATGARARLLDWMVKDQTGVTLDAGDQALVDGTVATNSPVAVPPWTVRVSYDTLPQVQTVDSLAAVVWTNTPARVDYLKLPYRTAQASDPTVRALHVNAPILNYTSSFVNQADAAAEAARQLALRKVRRDIIEVPLDSATPLFPPSTALSGAPFTLTPQDLNRGDVIELRLGRFDWDGKLFVVIGYVDDLGGPSAAGKTTLILWG